MAIIRLVEDIKFYRNNYGLNDDEIRSLIYSNKVYFFSPLDFIPNPALYFMIAALVTTKLILDLLTYNIE